MTCENCKSTRGFDPCMLGAMKPLAIVKVGRHFELYLRPQAALLMGRPTSKRKKWLASFASREVPLAVNPKDGKLEFVEGAKPAELTKEKAKDGAHMIGHYVLGLGDMVFSYTEGL